MKAETRPALAWDCPLCGHENFSTLIRCELTPEESASVAAHMEEEKKQVAEEMGCNPDDLEAVPVCAKAPTGDTCINCDADVELEVDSDPPPPDVLNRLFGG